jgi:hypothetical protein
MLLSLLHEHEADLKGVVSVTAIQLIYFKQI